MENTSRNFLFTWRNPDCVLRSGTNTGLRDSWVFSHTRIVLSTFIITLLESSSWLRIRVVKNNTAMIFSPWCQKMIDFLVNCRHLFSHLLVEQTNQNPCDLTPIRARTRIIFGRLMMKLRSSMQDWEYGTLRQNTDKTWQWAKFDKTNWILLCKISTR